MNPFAMRVLLPALAVLMSATAMAAAPSTPASSSSGGSSSGAATKKAPAPSGAPANEDDKLLYELGVLVSQSLDTFDLSDAEFKQVMAGLADGHHHRADEDQAVTYQQKIGALQNMRLQTIAAHQKVLGQAYVAKAAATPGATKTASGAVYIASTPGTGANPTAADQVKINYVGKLVDGTVFDSSAAHGGQASAFVVGRVIPCFGEALPLMKVGGKARVVCPAELAYGDKGHLPKIYPGATLDFEIELLDTGPAPAAAGPAIPPQQGPDRAPQMPPPQTAAPK